MTLYPGQIVQIVNPGSSFEGTLAVVVEVPDVGDGANVYMLDSPERLLLGFGESELSPLAPGEVMEVFGR